jgi:hypothetical protein
LQSFRSPPAIRQLPGFLYLVVGPPPMHTIHWRRSRNITLVSSGLLLCLIWPKEVGYTLKPRKSRVISPPLSLKSMDHLLFGTRSIPQTLNLTCSHLPVKKKNRRWEGSHIRIHGKKWNCFWDTGNWISLFY